MQSLPGSSLHSIPPRESVCQSLAILIVELQRSGPGHPFETTDHRPGY